MVTECDQLGVGAVLDNPVHGTESASPYLVAYVRTREGNIDLVRPMSPQPRTAM